MNNSLKFQIGKSGISQGVINSLELALKNHKTIRISALKSSGRDRNSIEQMANEIKSKLTTHCDTKIIGFTIILFKKSSFKK
ncbi:MAG: YhbY family RNA-binding protein [Candidatus Pacearchaeota archaeon]|nr:YhbY family RNA-binding protein [Candidatus Pacearchaeota archaeon]